MTYKTATVWCGRIPARRASCTPIAKGCIQPASVQETVSGIGTVMLALHWKYWHNVPSVGSRPQYFKSLHVLGLPRRQYSHLDRRVSQTDEQMGKRLLYSLQAKPGSIATLWPGNLSFTFEPTSLMMPADSCPRTSGFEILSLSQLWQSDPQIPVDMTCTKTSSSFRRPGRGRSCTSSCL